MKTLRFRPRGDALMPDFARESATSPHYVGRRKVVDETSGEILGFEPTGEDAVVPYMHEYVKACRDGDLFAADEATAKACGVMFDPTFGHGVAVSEPTRNTVFADHHDTTDETSAERG